MTHHSFGWIDFEEDDSTDEISGKYIATVGVWETDEEGYPTFLNDVYTLVHRDTEDYPITGQYADSKREDAAALANILNIARGWNDEAIDLHPEEALDAFSDIVEKVARILSRNS